MVGLAGQGVGQVSAGKAGAGVVGTCLGPWISIKSGTGEPPRQNSIQCMFFGRPILGSILGCKNRVLENSIFIEIPLVL